MNEGTSLRILLAQAHREDGDGRVLRLGNEEDVAALGARVGDYDRIELHFPHFTDGRAYSQAYLLRRRLGFKGDLRATGDVLADQLLQMARTGFSSAVLREDVDLADAERQFARFPGFYQLDARGHAATP
jgi:uncharacterized protein (DUF934 family)